jgi:hypothetical protein
MKLQILTNSRYRNFIIPVILFKNIEGFDYDNAIFNDTVNGDKYKIIELLNSNTINRIDKLKIIDDIQEKSYAINLQPDNIFE